MKERRTFILGIAIVSSLGLVSLGVSPKESLGCGGTEFESDTPVCSVAEFQMTMDSVDWEPVHRKMCLRALESEAGCTVYAYDLVGVDEDPPDRSDATVEELEIVHGRGCEAPRVDGTLVEMVDEKSVPIAMVGTPTRAPIPLGDTMEPLASGQCLSAEWDDGQFELRVKRSDEGP